MHSAADEASDGTPRQYMTDLPSLAACVFPTPHYSPPTRVPSTVFVLIGGHSESRGGGLIWAHERTPPPPLLDTCGERLMRESCVPISCPSRPPLPPSRRAYPSHGTSLWQ